MVLKSGAKVQLLPKIKSGKGKLFFKLNFELKA